MFNRVILMGRLCADPELKQTNSGIVYTQIRIAVNRPKKKDAEQEADFINVSCWRQTAEFVCRYFHKGNMILVEGCLRNNDYTDKNGVKHYSMQVLANGVSFCGEKNESPSQASASVPSGNAPRYDTVPAPANNPYAAQPQPQAQSPAAVLDDFSGFEEILSDGELPF